MLIHPVLQRPGQLQVAGIDFVGLDFRNRAEGFPLFADLLQPAGSLRQFGILHNGKFVELRAEIELVRVTLPAGQIERLVVLSQPGGGLAVRIVVTVGRRLRNPFDRGELGFDRGFSLTQKLHVLAGGKLRQLGGQFQDLFGTDGVCGGFRLQFLPERREPGSERIQIDHSGGQILDALVPAAFQIAHLVESQQFSRGGKLIKFPAEFSGKVTAFLKLPPPLFGGRGGAVRSVDGIGETPFQNLRIFRGKRGQRPIGFSEPIEFRGVIPSRALRQ